MLGIYIIIMVLILLAAILIISDYFKTVEAELDHKQSLINKLEKENKEYRRIADKGRENDKDCWGR